MVWFPQRDESVQDKLSTSPNRLQNEFGDTKDADTKGSQDEIPTTVVRKT